MRGLTGQRIVIAGGGNGIGAGTAERLAAEGATVVVGDINADAAQATAKRITDAGEAPSPSSSTSPTSGRYAPCSTPPSTSSAESTGSTMSPPTPRRTCWAVTATCWTWTRPYGGAPSR